MNAPEEDKLVIDLREESLSAQQVAWGRTDGGQDYAIAAQLADAAADRIDDQAARIAALEVELATARELIAMLEGEQARADKAEALLAEAVEALEVVKADCVGRMPLSHDGRTVPIGDGAWGALCKTLARIKEAKNG